MAATAHGRNCIIEPALISTATINQRWQKTTIRASGGNNCSNNTVQHSDRNCTLLANSFLALLGTDAQLKQNNISYWRLHHQPPAPPVPSTEDPCHGCSFILLIVYWWRTGRAQMLDASVTCPLGESLWDFVGSMWWWHPSRTAKHDPSMPILQCFVPKYWPPCWAFENMHKHKKSRTCNWNHYWIDVTLCCRSSCDLWRNPSGLCHMLSLRGSQQRIHRYNFFFPPC